MSKQQESLFPPSLLFNGLLMGIFQMLLTLQDRNFSPLAAPVGSGFY